MLVDVPELIEDPQFLAGEGIPSVMRLKILDESTGVWVDCADPLVQIALKGRSGSIDRKFAAIRYVFGQRTGSVGPGEGKDELVKGRSQVVNTVGSGQGDGVSRPTSGGINDDQIISGFRIGLLSNKVRVEFEPFLNGKVQVFQVDTCPLHLKLEAGEAR